MKVRESKRESNHCCHTHAPKIILAPQKHQDDPKNQIC